MIKNFAEILCDTKMIYLTTLSFTLIGFILSPVLLLDTYNNLAYIVTCFAIVRKQFDQR